MKFFFEERQFENRAAEIYYCKWKRCEIDIACYFVALSSQKFLAAQKNYAEQWGQYRPIRRCNHELWD